MRQYWTILGIGPWGIYTYAPPKLRETTVRGRPEPYSMKLALARVGSIVFELIQPLQGNSIYKEFLLQKGEGLHHIASHAVQDLAVAMAELKRRGIGELQCGKYVDGDFEAAYAYMDTEKPLGAILELVKLRDGKRPPPEETYP